jgi:hypothetical protein
MTGFYIDPDRPAEYGRASYVGGIIRAIFRSDGTLKTMFPMAPLFRPLRR